MYSWSLLGRSPQTAQSWKVCPASNPAGTFPCHLLSSGPEHLPRCHTFRSSSLSFSSFNPRICCQIWSQPCQQALANESLLAPMLHPLHQRTAQQAATFQLVSFGPPFPRPSHPAGLHCTVHVSIFLRTRTLHVDVLFNVASR